MSLAQILNPELKKQLCFDIRYWLCWFEGVLFSINLDPQDRQVVIRNLQIDKDEYGRGERLFLKTKYYGFENSL